MKYIGGFRSYIGVLFVVLFSSFLSIQVEAVTISALEHAEIMKNPDAIYVCLDSSMSNIKNVIFELSKLDKDKKSPLHVFKRYLRRGFNVGLYDEVIHVLEYAELVVQKKITQVGKNKIKPIAKKLSAIIQRVINQELNYDVRNIVSQSEEIEEIIIKEEANPEHRAPTIVFNDNIEIEDGLVVKKNAHVHGLLHAYNNAQVNGHITTKDLIVNRNARTYGSFKSYGDASFKNKATFADDVKFKKNVTIKKNLSVNSIVANEVDVADLISTTATINSLSATDVVINNLEVTNCIESLCVDDFSVVNEAVSGTLIVNNLSLTGGLAITNLSLDSLSVNDAVIQNLEVTNCIPSLCVQDASFVNGSTSGTFSINDAVIQTLEIPGGIVISNLSLNSLSSTDAVIDNLSVINCMNNLCVDTLSVMDLVVDGDVQIDSFSTAGVVHNDALGNLTTSLIVDADIAAGTITNDKLAGATSSDVPNTLVLRDVSGNFSTNMITIDGTVTASTDVATKAYVDSVSTGLDPKAPALVVATTNKVLSGLQTIDGVSLSINDRVLLVGQSFPTQNGLWLAQSGAWTRPADFASGTMAGQAYVLILSGTVSAGSSWLCNTPMAIIDTNPISFILFSLPGTTVAANVGAGTGLIFRNKIGNVLNFKSLIAGTNVTIANNANDITLGINATSANTPNSIVQRDSSGNFAAGTITANLIGNASSTTNFTGSLAGDVTGTQSATVVSFVGGQSAANVASTVTTVNAATAANTPSTIVKRNGSGNFSAGTITATLNGNATTATNFSGLLAGNVTGPQTATVVNSVGGQSAASIATATMAANAATSANTPNTIVKRDGSGNFSAGTITATLNGNATSTTNFSGSLAGDVTGTQSATVVSSVGGLSAAAVASGSAAANLATNANTPNTIVKRDGSGNFSAGTITATLNGNANFATNFSGTLVGDVTGTQTATVVSFVAGQTAASVGAATALTTAATSANTNGAIVRRDGSGNFAAGTITATLAGNATGFSGPLAGDVTGTQSATVVSSVGGQSAASVANAASLAGSATSANTVNTLVLRNGSGNFSAGTITATLNGNASTATTAGSTINFSGSLAGDVTGTQSATVVSFVAGQTAAAVANATTAVGLATNLNNPSTIVKRDGSGNFSAGTITANLSGNATGFTGPLVGDVTGTQPATAVSFVGGQSAVNVAAATLLANGATSANTFNAIVKRDSAGGFSAGTITATLNGTATNFSGSLAGDVTGIQTATVVSFVGGQSASNVAAATVLANAATNLDTALAIVRRDASGNFAAQTITADTGVTFTNGGSTLGYYLTGFGNVTFNANTGSPATLTPNVVYTRIGNIVTVTIAAESFTAAGSPQFYTAATALPATLFPTNGQVQTTIVPLVGANSYDATNVGTAIINSSGIITISKDANKVGTWSGVANGWDSITITYCV